MATYQNRKCYFCQRKIKNIDYKNTQLLFKFLSKYRKIVPRYYNGACLKHQKSLAGAVKLAREMALIPYTTGQ